ncbi:glycine radical domain-containing protein [Desulfosarcina sp. BuS5]|uniref:glycine radical domain-containing protein n=1 Tax=Desulfosarcina sp. BuS5 TaxID=933262 RepID=UPI0030829DB4
MSFNFYQGKENKMRLNNGTIKLVGEKGIGAWNAYIQSWCDLGINHVQFNIVDNETLLAAQEKPEDFEEMIVRVAGYSAQFVGLNKKTQDTIIARTIQEL